MLKRLDQIPLYDYSVSNATKVKIMKKKTANTKSIYLLYPIGTRRMRRYAGRKKADEGYGPGPL